MAPDPEPAATPPLKAPEVVPASRAPVASVPAERAAAGPRRGETQDRTLKVSAQTLNRLMGLAGESLVQSRWFEPFSDRLLLLKRRQHEISEVLDALQLQLERTPDGTQKLLAAARTKFEQLRQTTTEGRAEFEAFALRSTGLSDRLYREVVATRMRPFGDGVEG